MTRIRINLNREWKFFRGDAPGAHLATFDDSTWQDVGLPHTFDLPYFRTPEFYVGVGWYRKKLAISERTGGRIFLEFDGAFQVTELFLNGMRVGEHRGGYTGFVFDVTEFVHAGDNLLAVRVDNNWSPRLCPRAGEQIFSGGLYRDVHLLALESIHQTWHGTSITTPHVSRESATVRIVTEVANHRADSQRCAVRASLYDAAGALVASTEMLQPIAAGQTLEFDQQIEQVRRPLLWHPDHPNLYRMKMEIFAGGKLVDCTETAFGFRWFEWTSDRGFFLNGEHLYLRGANVHQDHAGWGIAITRAGCERDVRLMKEAGFNFVRGAHYPHHPAFADACDRLGLLFWSENCFWGKGGFGPEGYWNASAYPVKEEDFAPFEEHCKQTLREMIRQNRNHPSIIAWSMTNEAFFTYNLDRTRALIRDLAALSREADPTRPAAIGGAQRGEVDRLGDVAGYNGDGARLFINPGVPNMVSEYGAISKPHDAFEPFWGELQTERFPWRSGEAIWCGCDYGSIAGKQGLKGIVNHQRVPKRSWHWYRKELRGIDAPEFPKQGIPHRLRLHGDKTVILGTDGTDDCQITVIVCDETGAQISNSPPITLTIESGPGEFPTGRSITFDASTDITISGGEAAIAFRSYHGGESVIRATSPRLEDATITIHTEGEPHFVPGVTAAIKRRPYVPPPQSPAAIAALKNIVNVALNRPCRASSEHVDHLARFANDGDAGSFWAGDPGASWLLDLEGFYELSGIKLIFPEGRNWRYRIELSSDAATWTSAVDRMQTTRTDAVRNDITPPGSIARYTRITFAADWQASLCEVEAHGILWQR